MNGIHVSQLVVQFSIGSHLPFAFKAVIILSIFKYSSKIVINITFLSYKIVDIVNLICYDVNQVNAWK